MASWGNSWGNSWESSEEDSMEQSLELDENEYYGKQPMDIDDDDDASKTIIANSDDDSSSYYTHPWQSLTYGNDSESEETSTERLIRKGRECLEREKEEREKQEREERREFLMKTQDESSIDLGPDSSIDLGPDSQSQSQSRGDELNIIIPEQLISPLPSPVYIERLLSNLSHKTRLPEWEFFDNMTIDFNILSIKAPLTVDDWSKVQMHVEVIPAKGKQRHERGRKVLLFCTIPRKSVLVQCMIGISLFAAQACTEIFQKESAYITWSLTRLEKEISTLQNDQFVGESAESFFNAWWYTDDEGIKSLDIFRSKRIDDTEFVVYILGEGDIESPHHKENISTIMKVEKII